MEERYPDATLVIVTPRNMAGLIDEACSSKTDLAAYENIKRGMLNFLLTN